MQLVAKREKKKSEVVREIERDRESGGEGATRCRLGSEQGGSSRNKSVKDN